MCCILIFFQQHIKLALVNYLYNESYLILLQRIIPIGQAIAVMHSLKGV